MKVYLPNSAYIPNIETFLSKFDNKEPTKLEVHAHKKWISVHPVVIAMIAAIGERIKKENIVCEPLEARSAHYFERIGLFRFLDIEYNKKVREHEAAGRFIPLTRIKTSEEMTHFIINIIPLLHLPPTKVQPIRYVLSELIRNVIEHSFADHAVVCAQYHKESNILRIGVVDTGIGLKKSLKKTHIVHNDTDSIKLALTPGITGSTTRIGGSEQNAGAGLFFTKSLIKMSRGYFLIYSGNTVYKLLKTTKKSQVRLYPNPFSDKHKLIEDAPKWQGTVVGIDIDLNMEKPFSEFLESLRKLLKKTVQEQKEEIRKKVRFT